MLGPVQEIPRSVDSVFPVQRRTLESASSLIGNVGDNLCYALVREASCLLPSYPPFASLKLVLRQAQFDPLSKGTAKLAEFLQVVFERVGLRDSSKKL